MSLNFQIEIDQLIAIWRPLLDLTNWDLHISYDEQLNLASCEARPMYLEAFLRFNVVRMQKEISTVAQLEELVVHELIHVRLWMLANMFIPDSEDGIKILEYFEEEATSHLTGALLRTKYAKSN